MIRLILLFIIFIVNIITIWSQDICDEDKGISTNPDNSVNNEYTAKRNSSPVLFDWRDNLFVIRSSLTTSADILSPFYNSNNATLDFLYDNKDFKPEDGWELIKQEFGWPFDAEDDEFTTDIDYPAFILYNRYLGILRVFVAVFQVGLYDEASIQIATIIQGNDGHPSTLDLASGTRVQPLRALSEFSAAGEFTSVTRFLNTDRHWMYADFPVMYDPCVCGFKSELYVNVKLIDNAKISLSGTLDGQIVSIDNTNNNVATEASSLSLGLNNVIDAAKAASQSYNDWSAFKQSTLDKINAYNQYGPYLSQEMKDKIDKQRELRPASLNFLESIINKSGFLKNALKAVPYVSAAVEALSFFVGGGKEVAGPQEVKVMPMSIQATLALNGEITNSGDYRDIIFRTPGSYFPNPSDYADQYPYYNEPLGVFNLLTPPTVEWYHNLSYGQLPTHDTLRARFNGELEYVINFNAGFDPNDYEILAALVFEYDNPLVTDYAVVVPRDVNANVIESDRIVRTKYVPIGCLSELPIDFTRQSAFPSGGCNCWAGFPDGTGYLYLKTLVRLKKASESDDDQRILWVGKYKCDKTELEQQPNSYWESPYYGFDEDLNIDGTAGAITHSTSESVWRKISIGPNVLVTTDVPNPPAIVELVAGSEIVVSTNYTTDVVIEPNTILKIGLPGQGQCTTSIAPATTSRIQEFCGSNAYKANRGFIKVGDRRDPEQLQKVIITVLPNPATSLLRVSYRANIGSVVSLKLIDDVGRVIKILRSNKVIDDELYFVSEDVSQLSDGVYLLASIVDDLPYMTRVVILH